MPSRWDNTTAEERRAAMAEVTSARRRAAIDRRIAELIAIAPPLSEAQKEKLAQLLDTSQPESGAS